ncbi:alpha-amylase family glycosyl hydrolase [Ornithinimicrobium panacihumi]|uniref:alpha-amylase family glycosyl hydrolase n=1 Tax=Ornithinimicrobium panacihumi TaxID=2008449 RepID=UPI003F889FC4
MSRTARRWLVVAVVALLVAVVALAMWFARDGSAPEGGSASEDGSSDAGQVEDEQMDQRTLESLVRPASQGRLTGERFYFVLPDRFVNGDPGNDRGAAGQGAGREAHGFDPTDVGYYHGGDLKGLRDNLDYLEELGVTAVWMTPVMTNRAVQGEGKDASAGYHGYWVTDFTSVDPHLGTRADLEALVEEAHERDMKVFLDIITNHTADVIDYEEGEYAYRPTGEDPYTPVFRAEEDGSVKAPEWLNDPERYHNRGNSTFEGESSILGDFSGLEDLATEQPEVVEGMVGIYQDWVDVGVDGFRIDTVKHVDLEFWQAFAPALLAHADEVGNEDFFMFGEVYDASPTAMSTYSTAGALPATLDFGFQAAATEFVKGAPASRLQQLYDGDDWYTDADSGAAGLPTFLGNHDMGRAAHLYAPAALLHSDLADRVELAHSLMFLTRGQPVVYYGDEQGFVGRGGDKQARQDMLPTQVEAWAAQEDVHGEPLGEEGHLDRSAPLYQHIAELSRLREEHPVLAEGAQIVHPTAQAPSVFAASRVLIEDGIEHLVLVNNGVEAAEVQVPTASPGAAFELLWGEVANLSVAADGRLTATVPPLGVVLLRADRSVPEVEDVLDITLAAPSQLQGRAQVMAEVGGGEGPAPLGEVTFLARAAGEEDWTHLGTDDAPPYRVYPVADMLPEGQLELMAVLRPWRGPLSSATSVTEVIHAKGAAAPAAPGQPAQVVAAGTFQAVAGCTQDWDPACASTALSFDKESSTWSIDLVLQPGDHEFKIAVDGSWDENYGADGVPDGANIALPSGGAVRVVYDHADHVITVTPGD